MWFTAVRHILYQSDTRWDELEVCPWRSARLYSALHDTAGLDWKLSGPVWPYKTKNLCDGDGCMTGGTVGRNIRQPQQQPWLFANSKGNASVIYVTVTQHTQVKTATWEVRISLVMEQVQHCRPLHLTELQLSSETVKYRLSNRKAVISGFAISRRYTSSLHPSASCCNCLTILLVFATIQPLYNFSLTRLHGLLVTASVLEQVDVLYQCILRLTFESVSYRFTPSH